MILKITAKPNSSKQKVEKISEQEYKISLKSVPENNKANIELIKLLSKYFNTLQSNIKIKSGLNSRRKIVEII